MQAERRELRSNDPTAAIRIFLARNATEDGMRAAVVADDGGRFIGGVGDGDLASLAALGTTLADVRGVSERGRVCREHSIEPDQVHVVRLGVGNRRFVITSIGAPLGAAGPLGAVLDRVLAA